MNQKQPRTEQLLEASPPPPSGGPEPGEYLPQVPGVWEKKSFPNHRRHRVIQRPVPRCPTNPEHPRGFSRDRPSRIKEGRGEEPLLCSRTSPSGQGRRGGAPCRCAATVPPPPPPTAAPAARAPPARRPRPRCPRPRSDRSASAAQTFFSGRVSGGGRPRAWAPRCRGPDPRRGHRASPAPRHGGPRAPRRTCGRRAWEPRRPPAQEEVPLRPPPCLQLAEGQTAQEEGGRGRGRRVHSLAG